MRNPFCLRVIDARRVLPATGLAMAVLAAALLAAAPADVSARIYKWVDEDGNVQYTQTPPPENARQLDVKVYPGPGEAGAEEDAESDDGEQAGKEGEQPTEEQKARQEQLAMEQAEQKKKNCETVRNNLKLLEAGARVHTTDEDGNQVFLDDEARQQALERNREQVKEFCE